MTLDLSQGEGGRAPIGHNGPPKLRSTIKREGDFAVVRIPIDEITEFATCLADCPCRANKSTATTSRRRALRLGLISLIARKR